MSSTPLLFSSHVPVTSANSAMTPGQGSGVQGEGAGAEGNFLASFSELMQKDVPTGNELQNPLITPENFGLDAEVTADAVILEDALTLEIPGVDSSLDGLLEDSTAMPVPLDAALPISAAEGSWMLYGIADGIPADDTALPPVVTEGAENPALALNISSPPPVTASTADVSILDQPNSKRLDLTQWLSSATAGSEPILPEESAAATSSTFPSTFPSTLSLPGVLPAENADALLKNALFARALPKAEGLPELEFELNLPAIPETKPVTGPAQTAGFTEIVNTGRITVPLNITFGHPQWPEALAERAGFLAHQRIHSADLQLDPPELGPLQIKISVQQDQAVVSFVSANPQVRDMLDQSLVRLRELLQEQGMQLVDAGVSDQQSESNENTRSTAEGLLGAAGDDESSAISDTDATHAQVTMTWGVDDFV